MRTIIATFALAVVALSGCVGDEGKGSASIYVKDAATDEFDEIHVVFTKVEVHAAGGEDASEDDGDGNWTVVYENTTGYDVDLLNLSGDRAAFLGEADLESGKYTQIRIHSTEAYGIRGEERIDFQMSPTPLKVVKSFDIDADQETRIVLDFDLDSSVKEQGPNGWRMTPVIGRTIATIVEDEESGGDVHEEGEVTEIEGSGS